MSRTNMKMHLIKKLSIHDAVVTHDHGHVATCVSRLRVECWWLSHKRVHSSSPRHFTGQATFSRGRIQGGPRLSAVIPRNIDCTFLKDA